MATMNKVKLGDFAKDFSLTAKDIAAILTKYKGGAYNAGKGLDREEMCLVFERLTQDYPSTIEAIFAETPKKEEKKAEAAPVREKSAAPKQQQAHPQNAQAGKNAAPKQQQASAVSAAPAASRVPQKKVVDTRKAANVNLDKYDERLQDMADRSGGGKRNMEQGREKFRGKQKNNAFAGNKRRQEEAEKMRRLQLEIVKKTPLTVQIPDEISVGELASRMKKTGAEVVKALMKEGVMASLSAR